jgi:glycosyltransferase involved in cell wall biosynthesis
VKRVGLFLGASPSHGGVFQYSEAILEALARINDPQLSIVVRYIDPEWQQVLREYGVDARYIPRGRLVRVLDAALWRIPLRVPLWRRTLAYVHSITRALARDACDLWIFPAQDIWTYLTPAPALGAVHDLMHRYEPSFPEVAARKIYRQRERHFRRICRWARGVLVESATGREQLTASYGVDPGKVFVLPYIAPRHVRNAAGTTSATRPLPQRFFFYPAQFWEHKNHVRLLGAIAMVRERHPDVRIVFAGAPKNGYKRVLAEVSARGLEPNVVFLGYVSDSDMPGIYQRARALVMPTFLGPTNIPPLEAFALGCPVATSRIYGIPEQVGDAALLFDPNSVAEIADTLEQLWTNDELCATLAERGRHRAAQWGATEFGSSLGGIVRKLIGGTPA